MFNLEKNIQKLEKEVETRIILEFMRHGKRQKGATPEEDASYDLRLTTEGRKQMSDKGKKLGAQKEVSLGWGSPRIRAQESAYHAMLANYGITAEDNFEDIEKKIFGELKVGKKMKIDDRLNFSSDGPVGKEGDEAYYMGKYLPYIINESDERAIVLADQKSSTYTRIAGNIAEIVKRHVKIGNNFNRTASEKDDYVKFGNQLERYLGTHQGISESFAAKILEKVDGPEKKKEFVEALGGGFKEGEGIRIEIINKGINQTMIMHFKINETDEKVEFDNKILDEIITERDVFEKQVASKCTMN